MFPEETVISLKAGIMPNLSLHCQYCHDVATTYSGFPWDKTCIKHVFLMLWNLGPCWPRRDCPSQDWWILKETKLIICEHAFYMKTNQSRAQTPSHLLYQAHILHILRSIIPCNHPSSRHQIPEDSPCAPEPAENTIKPLAYIVCSFPLPPY